MPHLVKISLLAGLSLTFVASEASAQFYNPVPAPQYSGHHPGGLGLDLGLRDYGFNPNVGAGIGPVGAGVGAGLGRRGIGAGVNTGVGPLGGAVDAGLSRNGLGARGSAGIGRTTGAAFEGGISRGGVGVGASAKVLNIGAGASLGVGKRGPGLGANIGFGPLGTLLIGSHRNSYPGARQTESHIYSPQSAPYYTTQNYGNAPYYRPQPADTYGRVQPYHRAQPYQNVQYYQAAQPVRYYAPAATAYQPQYRAQYSSYGTYSGQRQPIASRCAAPWTC